MADFFAQDLLKKLPSMDPMTAAVTTQDASAKAGFEYRTLQKVLEMVGAEHREMEEAFAEREQEPEAYHKELGDLLYSLIKLCHWSGVSPDQALAKSTEKYVRRLAWIEDRLMEEGKQWSDLDHAELEPYWTQAKAAGI